MLAGLKIAIKAFFSGGSSYVYIALGTLLVGGYFYIQHLEADVKKLKDEVTQQETLVDQGRNLVNAHVEQEERKGNLDSEFSEAETKINNETDTQVIADSPSITSALDWVRDNPDPSSTRPD